MSVRWKTREDWHTKYQCSHNRNTDKIYCSGKTKEHNGKSFSAALVRSERVDGKPRQCIVAYLGHIKEKYLGVLAQRLYFWESVVRHLAALPLSPVERQRIEEQIRARVERPPREAVERDRQESLDKLLKHFSRL
jgi:hypothetical protein